MKSSPSTYLLGIAVVALAAAACAGSENPASPVAVQPPYQDHPQPKKHRLRHGTQPIIYHVFVIVQENRTVDNLFQDSVLISRGANIQNYGYSGNTRVQLQPVPMATAADYGHTLRDFLADTGCPETAYIPPCPMSGFSPPSPSSPGAYAFVDPSDTPAVKSYFEMAEQYGFGDNMFTSHLDASFVSHQYLVAAQANSAVDFPLAETGCVGSGPNVYTITQHREYGNYEPACFTYNTIVDELKAANLPWRYYQASPESKYGLAWWTPFIWIPHDKNGPGGMIIQPPSQFLSDIKSTSGYNAAVTWITPSRRNSDHSGGFTDNGSPNWVASVVNAIGESPYWLSSVIFITWDDWGGWYDHVTPPYKDYDGLGVRVPFIIISPYTTAGLITHTQYEQASILKYIESNFGISPLHAADMRANNPVSDVLSNLPGTPRPFATISAGPYFNQVDPGAPDNQ